MSKGGVVIRKPFNTPIDTDIQTEFKVKCKLQGIKYNDAIEAMMQAFIDEKIEINVKTVYDVSSKKKSEE